MTKLLSLGYLKSAKSAPHAPFELEILGSDPFICEEIFRHLPGKRLAFRSSWGGAEALVKLFFERKYLEIEQAGLHAMQESGVPYPKKIWGLADKEGGYFIATEFLPQATTLQNCYESLSKEQLQPLLSSATKLIGMLHCNGWMQSDVHLGNFMLSQGKIYMIDGGGIKKLRNPENNLALFFAQMVPDYDDIISSVISSYTTDLTLADDFLKKVRNTRELRIKRYISKTMRSCTQFHVIKRRHFFATIKKNYLTKKLNQLIEEPEVVIGQSKFIKRGNSATVVNVAVGDCSWVIKRYNIKDLQHKLSRCLRPSRACVSWKGAHRLILLGINTPKPIAMRENKHGLFRREAYLVTEFVEGKDLRAWLLASKAKKVPSWLGKEVFRLFDILFHGQVTHGDMKATNFIISGKTLHVIDLDSLQWHESDGSLNRAFTRDIERFMENWQGDTWIYFEKLLRPFAKKLNITLTNKKV